MVSFWTILSLGFTILTQVNAEVRVSGIFTNNMVLQIPYPTKGVPPTRIFGTALLNEIVTITGSSGFPGPFTLTPNCTNGQPCQYGNWSAPLIPNTNDPSFPGPYTITITSKSNTTNQITGSISINNTYFGEVFLCSGQSNMEYKVYQCSNFQNELNYSTSLPNIRLYLTNVSYQNYTMQNVSSQSMNGHSGWVVSGPGAINDFSCVCWESGRIITQWLMQQYPTKKPYVGLIESNVGGTSVYFWAAGIAGRACNLTGNLPSSGEAADPALSAGGLYNSGINPLCMNKNGISIRQAIFYQGEADTGENDMFNQNAYTCTLNGLIYTWRYCFNQTYLPFINIQLPNGMVFPYANDDTCQIKAANANGYGGMSYGWAGVEVAQYKTYAMNRNTGMVTDEDNGQNTLHYPYKLEVSQRVALWMRYLTFDDPSVTRYHAMYGIEPKKKLKDTGAQPVPPKFVKAYRKATDEDPLKVYIEIENTGAGGMKLQPAVNCSAFNNKYGSSTICISNCTIYYCCDLSGANTLKFRMEGWYWYSRNGQGRNLGLMNWLPGNVTGFQQNGVNNNSVIVAKPIVPEIGGINWPSGGDSVLSYEALGVREVEIGTSNACVWMNSFGIPISKGGPYDIDIMDY